MIDPKRKKTSKHIQQPEKNWLKKIEVGFFLGFLIIFFQKIFWNAFSQLLATY